MPVYSRHGRLYPLNPNKETAMKRFPQATLAAAVALAMAGAVYAADMKVSLAGDQEVPPVNTQAKGSGTVVIGDDGAVSGVVTTTGVTGTAAHIHQAAAGKNGPVIVPMVKSGDSGWTFAPGAKLNPDQMNALKAGELYVNVHSAANPGGEIRGQLK
jgi:CHRD domain